MSKALDTIERLLKEAEKNRAEAERMETFEAAIRDAAKKGGPYCVTHAREAVAALDAARLAGTIPIDAPPAKEPR